ncbi:MAG: MmgE/PrpD family protein [Alphaproteobacteria bacterium]
MEGGPIASVTPISATLAEFAADLDYGAIPERIRERAKHLILDAVGIALASTRYDYAHKTLTAARGLGGAGPVGIIGMPARLPARDAALVNGVLVHGLDYDDTHTPGIIHSTSSAFPCTLAVASDLRLTGREMLAAYVAATETATRVASVAKGGFHQVGFHPTGMIGIFGCAIAAARLMGANPQQIAMAQGIALSMAAGSLEFIEDGASTKRMHPGWAASSAITAAAMARQGFTGPSKVYEGRFGLFASYLGPREKNCDYTLATAGLGSDWELEIVAVKPYPACHFNHATGDATLAIMEAHGIGPDDVAHVRVRMPEDAINTVCEPIEQKRNPVNSYAAQFSIPYMVAACLARGRFGLAELEPDAVGDPAIRALAAKVECEVDPDSPFPKFYSGEVIITTNDGRELSHREEVNRGASERPLTNDDVVAKYFDNAAIAVSRARAEAIRDLVLGLDGLDDIRSLTDGLTDG